MKTFILKFNCFKFYYFLQCFNLFYISLHNEVFYICRHVPQVSMLLRNPLITIQNIFYKKLHY